MKIGAKIRKFRLAKNYSQRHMAEVLDISQGYYNKIENEQANLTVDKLQMIAKELGVPPFALLDDGNSNWSNTIEINNGNVNSANVLNISYSEEERQLYKEQIKNLKEQIIYLKEIIARLK